MYQYGHKMIFNFISHQEKCKLKLQQNSKAHEKGYNQKD